MMRSMYSSVSGLKVHQQMVDIIGNNIANINTIGFKGSRVTFKEMLTQTIKGASSPQDGQGGTNPMQVGLGVTTGSIDTNMESGNLQPTGKKSDAAIMGDGFFIVNEGTEQFYTRAGSFSFDKDGYLFNTQSGLRVQGWVATEEGNIVDTTEDNLEDIYLDKSMNPQETSFSSFQGNLAANQLNGFVFSKEKVEITDGTDRDTITVSAEPKTNSLAGFNEWSVNLTAQVGNFDVGAGTSKTTSFDITLDETGQITSLPATPSVTYNLGGSSDPLNLFGGSTGVDIEGQSLFPTSTTNFTSIEETSVDYQELAQRDISIDVYDTQGTMHTIDFPIVKTDFNEWTIPQNKVAIDGVSGGTPLGGDHIITFDGTGNILSGDQADFSFVPGGGITDAQNIELDFSFLTQFSGDMTADFKSVDGYPQGEFQTFAIDSTGKLTGSFDNGQNKTLAQFGLATFQNSAGLTREGGLFSTSNNSGDARIGIPGVDGVGELAPSSLEMSNVDLAQQFTDMITAQRGFQASSKLITTSDEMLQQLVNLKR